MVDPYARLADGFPHGTLEGANAGCQAADCPARPLQCKEVASRHRVDARFRRHYDAGHRGQALLNAIALEQEADLVGRATVSPAHPVVRSKRASAEPNLSEYRVLQLWVLLDGNDQIVLGSPSRQKTEAERDRLRHGDADSGRAV